MEQELEALCARRAPVHVQDRVKVACTWRGDTVTLLEWRPSFGGGDPWVDIAVAQFRFNAAKGTWTLYCADRNSRWHVYDDTSPTEDFQSLLAEVDEDPTGIFWG